MVDPELADCASLATASRRAATTERVELEVVLKYSLNLEADPDLAAVAAALASLTVLDRAFSRADLRLELLQVSLVRRSSGLIALVTVDALTPSMSSFKSFELYGRYPVTEPSLTIGTRPLERRVTAPPLDRSVVVAMSNSSSMTSPASRVVRDSDASP